MEYAERAAQSELAQSTEQTKQANRGEQTKCAEYAEHVELASTSNALKATRAPNTCRARLRTPAQKGNYIHSASVERGVIKPLSNAGEMPAARNVQA